MIKKIISAVLSASLIMSNAVCIAKSEEKFISVNKSKEVRFEAEDYAIINSAYEIINDEKLFPGNDSEYLYIPLTVDANLGFNLEGEPEHYYNINIEEEGMYDVWVYMYARDTGVRAFNYNFDNSVFSLRESDYDPPGWRWMLMASKHFTEGMHTMGFIHRHKLTPIDKFIITSEPDFNPDGAPISVPEFLPNTGESAEYDYNLPPIAPPAGQHPRVLINDSSIEEIKANLDHDQNKTVYETVKMRADIETDGKFPPMSASATSNISLETCDVILSNAFLYALFKEPERGKKAFEIAKNALMTAEGKGKGTDAFTRQGGHLMFVASCMYDWCYDIMTDEDREFLRKYLYRIATNMEIGFPTTAHPGNIHGHNLEMQVWKDMMAMAIAIYDEDPKMYNHIGGRVFDQMIPVRNELNKSIFFSEGPTYGPMRFSCGLYTTYYLKAMGYENVFGDQQQTALYGQLYRRRPDGRMLHNSDDANEDLYGYTTGGGGENFLNGNLYNDPILKREYYRQLKFGNSNTTDTLGPGAVMHLIVNNVDIPVDKLNKELPLTVYSPDGTMVARTSWDEGLDADTVLVQMNAKDRFYGMHDHMDAGHFDIYYKGSLAIDSGIYESDPFVDQDGNLISSNLTHGSKHWYGYSRRAIAHNVMLVKDPSETIYEMYNKININDGGQKEDGGGYDYEDLDNFNTGKTLSYDFGPDLHTPAYSYLKGDLKGAYTDKIDNYDRSFMFLNFFDEEYPAALIILDSVESSSADFEKTWLLHSQEEPEVEGNKTTIKRTEFGYNGRLINETLLPASSTIEKIGGEGKQFYYDGYNYGAMPKVRTQEAGNWRVEISPTGNSKTDYFLNVMQMSDNSDEIVPLEAELIENDIYIGVKIKDRAVFLKKNDELTLSDTVISCDGEGTFTYIIDGMREGRWIIYDKNDKKVGDCIVEKGHNVVSFEQPAGEYRLSWQYMGTIPQKDYSMFANIKQIDGDCCDIQIDRIFQNFDSKMYMKGSELYLSLEELLQKINKAFAKKDGIYEIGDKSPFILDLSNSSLKNAKETVYFQNKIETKNETIFVPASEFCSAMGYSYEWDNNAKICYISSGEDIVSKLKLFNPGDPDRVVISKATASSAPYSSPYDCVDGNIGSYWGGQGDGEWIMLEFEEESPVAFVDIKWHTGDQRSAKFDIQLSVDGENWTTVYSGNSSGTSKTYERNVLNAEGTYKYVRILGHGNSVNDWNSISEINVYNSISE